MTLDLGHGSVVFNESPRTNLDRSCHSVSVSGKVSTTSLLLIIFFI